MDETKSRNNEYRIDAIVSDASIAPARYCMKIISAANKYLHEDVEIEITKKSTQTTGNLNSIMSMMIMCLYEKEEVEITVRANQPVSKLEEIALEIKKTVETKTTF